MGCPYCGGGYQIIGDLGFNDDGDYVALVECEDCGKEFVQFYAVEIDWDNPLETLKKEDYELNEEE
jgi:hypothetical protein